MKREIKQEKFEKAFFPSIEYIDNIQKLQGISLIKLVIIFLFNSE